MSQANVELILATVGAYNDGDIDAWAEFLDPEIEAVPDTSFPESHPLLGRDEYRAWTEQLTMGLLNPRWETTEVLDLRADRVLHRGNWGGKGAASGIETYSSISGVFTVREGQISRVEFYFDHERALKAAGLAGEVMSEANVEIVRRSFEAHRAGGIEAALPFYAPDFVWDAGPDWFEERIYRGHDGGRRLDAIFAENFEDYSLAVHEIRAVGEQVLALYEAIGRIRNSGFPLRQPVG